MKRTTSTFLALFVLVSFTGCPPVTVHVYGNSEFTFGAKLDQFRAEVERDLKDPSAGGQNHFRLKLGQAPPRPRPGWNPVFSLVHASDVQINDKGVQEFGRVLRRIADKFTHVERDWLLDENDHIPYLALVGALNSLPPNQRPAFLLHTGDAINAGTDGELVAFLAISNELKIPWFNTVGNHDILIFGNFTRRGIEIDGECNGARPVDSRMSFTDYHGWRPDGASTFPGLTRHPATEQFAPLPSSGSWRHGFDHIARGCRLLQNKSAPTAAYSVLVNANPKVRLIVIDTNVTDEVIPHIRRYDIPGIGALGTISETQYNWLDRELRYARSSNELVIVAGHHPLLRDEDDNDDPLKGLRGIIDNFRRNQKKLRERLKSEPHVIAYLCGHTHEGKIVVHNKTYDGREKLVELVAPSLVSFPQQAAMVTLLKKGPDGSAFEILPVKGEVLSGSPLQTRLDKAAEGARREDGKTGPCWQDDADTKAFVVVK